MQRDTPYSKSNQRATRFLRQELVGWLQQQIAQQKRADLATSSAPMVAERDRQASKASEAYRYAQSSLPIPTALTVLILVYLAKIIVY